MIEEIKSSDKELINSIVDIHMRTFTNFFDFYGKKVFGIDVSFLHRI